MGISLLVDSAVVLVETSALVLFSIVAVNAALLNVEIPKLANLSTASVRISTTLVDSVGLLDIRISVPFLEISPSLVSNCILFTVETPELA